MSTRKSLLWARAVYTVRFGNAIYVLHCFQKSHLRELKRRRATSN
ncbi:type II toxin-antitoxin system RelE/ParE family toxin [Pseudomonas sp. TH10]